METTLLVFTAKWCGACESQMDILSGLAKIKDSPIAQIDIDKHPALEAKYFVSTLPMIVLVDTNTTQPLGVLTKIQTIGNIKDMISKVENKCQK